MMGPFYEKYKKILNQRFVQNRVKKLQQTFTAALNPSLNSKKERVGYANSNKNGRTSSMEI